MGNIEKEDITFQTFVWKDGEHKCEAGKLLCALTELTDTKQHVTKCSDEEITSYLREKGLVEEHEGNLRLVSDKEEEATILGTQISNYIGEEIESIPTDKIIRMIPSIMLSPVPIPGCNK